MASAIDPTKPIEGTPTTASVRDNFAAAKSEIEILQATAGVGPRGVSIWAHGTFSNVTNISQVAGMAVGDYVVNTTTSALTFLTVLTQPGGIVRSTSATAGVAAGNIRGPQGTNAALSLGTTTTVESPANANVIQGGTPENRTLSFQIPRGIPGPQGTPGLGAGGLALTSGGTVGQKLVKRSATNGDAAWVGSAEDLPVVQDMYAFGSMYWVLKLDRPAPANLLLVYWRFSRGYKNTRRAFRAINPYTTGYTGSPWYTPVAASATEIVLNYQKMSFLYRPGRWIRGRSSGGGSIWWDKLNNRYIQINPNHLNKIRYRIGTVLSGQWNRKSPMSTQTLELMQWVDNPNNGPSRVIARIY